MWSWGGGGGGGIYQALHKQDKWQFYIDFVENPDFLIFECHC